MLFFVLFCKVVFAIIIVFSTCDNRKRDCNLGSIIKQRSGKTKQTEILMTRSVYEHGNVSLLVCNRLYNSSYTQQTESEVRI